MEGMAFLETDKVAEQDIRAGLFDYATVDAFLINFEDPSMGVMWMAKGWTIGEIEARDNVFHSELRGKAQYLQQGLCDTYSASCRATLGDAKCGVDLDESGDTYRHWGTVTGVSDAKKVFTDDTTIESTGADEVFRFGKLVWLDPSTGSSFNGDNAGYEMEVKAWDPATGTFTLFLPMPYDIQAGDEFLVYYGCDKSHGLCQTRFANIARFRGEPYVPGMDELMADVRSGTKKTRGMRPRARKGGR